MKAIEKKCLQCFHAHRDPNATPEQVLTGTVQHLCLEGPPTASPIPTQRGVVLMTVYPSVNADSISCARFACETLAVGG